MKLYARYLAIQLKSQLEYRASFVMKLAAQFFLAFSAVASVFFMLDRFGAIGGFVRGEVLFCFSVANLGFSLAECIFRGFDTFSGIISDGRFDRMLVRPKGLVFQIIASKAEFSKLGRVGAAIVVLVLAIAETDFAWSIGRGLLLVFMLAGSITYFAGLQIIYAGFCFFTLKGLEFMNIFTDGGRELGQYPLAVYGKGVLIFFTALLPLACAQYWPFLVLCGRSDSVIYALAPAVCFVFLIPCMLFWRFGLKHYVSTGS